MVTRPRVARGNRSVCANKHAEINRSALPILSTVEDHHRPPAGSLLTVILAYIGGLIDGAIVVKISRATCRTTRVRSSVNLEIALIVEVFAKCAK